VQPTNGDAKAVVTYREIENALTEGMMNEAISRLGEAAQTPEQGDRFLADFAQALRLIELEEEQADPELLTVPRDRLASLTLSSLAEDPPEGSSFVELATGGAEVVFSNRDILGWLRSLFDWVGQLRPHPMMRPSGIGPAEIPNQARAALLGDWGTGLYGAVPCAESIRQDRGHFDLLMHLGDVYYSGTKREVQERFLNVWPHREGAINRSINSNHEMYSGGYAYFEKTLPEFGQESSYFALQNDHWLLVGLDVAYIDHDIDDSQVDWLERVIAAAGDRKVLLFSHHQLFSRFDDQGPRLAAKLGGLLRSGRIFAWYWGHEHRCVLYEPDPRYGGLLGRCLGHGGMPYTRTAVANIPRDHTVGQSTWRRFETKNMVPGGLVLDGPNPYIQGHETEYGPHGYMTLEFQGQHLVEVIHNPTGEEIYRQEIRR
jgi:hypothetical protein